MAKDDKEPTETPGTWALLHGCAAGGASIAMWEIAAGHASSQPLAIVAYVGVTIGMFAGVVFHNHRVILRKSGKCPKCKRPLPRRRK